MTYREIHYKGKKYYTTFHDSSFSWEIKTTLYKDVIKKNFFGYKKIRKVELHSERYHSKSKFIFYNDWTRDLYDKLEDYQVGVTRLIENYLNIIGETEEWLNWDGNLTPEYKKIEELKKENKVLKKENEDLKKTFSEEFRENVIVHKEFIN